MKDKVFVDTNILIYYVSNNVEKKILAKELIINNEGIVISSQVINEFVSVVLKKHILPYAQVVNYSKEFMDIFEFSIINKETILQSFDIKSKYGYSNWDALIITSALENNCSLLYSEDMQHGQTIDDNLTIINPFK